MNVSQNSFKQPSKKLSFIEKLSYGFGDLASNFVWGMTTSYLLFFYTDIFGLAAGAVGTLFLLTRIWDAVNDPLMGILVDKTNTKHGKARPYILYLAIPFAIISVLTFITPDFSYTGKLIYAYVTYTLLGMIYTAINLPYGALMSMMTRDSEEKAKLSSFRMMGMATGAILVSVLTLELVDFFGNGNQQLGFPITMGVFSLIAIGLFMMTFRHCKERYAEYQTADHEVDVKKSMTSLMKNGPWRIVSLNALILFLRVGAMSGVLIYYITYVLERPGLAPLYLGLLNAAYFVGAFFAPSLLKKLGNRNGTIVATSMALLLFISLIFLESAPQLLFASLFFLANAAIGIGNAATLAMLADTVDYQEYKFGTRSEGTLYASYSFATKLGIALGSAFVAYALDFAGYTPEALTEGALSMIRFLMFAAPIVFTALQIFVLFFYKLDRTHAKIVQHLKNNTITS
ncbi:MFS transporter [Bacillaceae bacterium SIJ1]|uniref:glycoside-pentoside-hexuronide (GPH):cation symporter n=1 Tax=Litoribacterium kuwaitense TaxID=1398745 RepID=UPI0013EB1C01|nr:glycoside-pentoside-hexuronide (GPH):cation symporter [Litoribacterium kuwaitense]NGP45239.1 MFS transporter [Litoribacterium kuwaitense]